MYLSGVYFCIVGNITCYRLCFAFFNQNKVATGNDFPFIYRIFKAHKNTFILIFISNWAISMNAEIGFRLNGKQLSSYIVSVTCFNFKRWSGLRYSSIQYQNSHLFCPFCRLLAND